MMSTIALSSTTAPFAHPRPAPEPAKGFLVPGVFGDEPQLRSLRKRLQHSFDLDLLALPDVETRSSVLTSMVATAGMLVDEVVRRCPTGPVSLIGYSFGASVALEVAVQLSDVGREVAFLGVLDGPFEPPKVTLHKKIGLSPMSLFRSCESFLLRSVSSKSPVRRAMARFVLSGTTVNYRADAMRRAMLWHLRNKALTSWTPRPCASPGLHVCSGNYGTDNRARWVELCPNLDRVEVPAAHKDLLKRRALKAIVSSLEAAAEVRRSSPSGFDGQVEARRGGPGAARPPGCNAM